MRLFCWVCALWLWALFIAKTWEIAGTGVVIEGDDIAAGPLNRGDFPEMALLHALVQEFGGELTLDVDADGGF